MSSEALNHRFIYIPRPALWASIGVHLAFLLAVVTSEILDRYNIHLFGPKKMSKEMYQEFIQVDVVGLPQNLIKDLEKTEAALPIVDKVKQAEKEEAPEPTPVPEETALETPAEKAAKEKEAASQSKLEKTKKAAEEAAKKKKTEETAKKLKEKKEAEARDKALKKLKAEASREAALKALSPKKGQTGRNKIAGNILSKGTATTGMIGNARDRYGALVTQKIREHFNIFTWQKKKGLVAVVYLEIYPNGRVRKKSVLRRSIDPLYDSAVLEAIEEAQPLPVPEDASILDGGLTVEFRPELPGG